MSVALGVWNLSSVLKDTLESWGIRWILTFLLRWKGTQEACGHLSSLTDSRDRTTTCPLELGHKTTLRGGGNLTPPGACSPSHTPCTGIPLLLEPLWWQGFTDFLTGRAFSFSGLCLLYRRFYSFAPNLASTGKRICPVSPDRLLSASPSLKGNVPPRSQKGCSTSSLMSLEIMGVERKKLVVCEEPLNST